MLGPESLVEARRDTDVSVVGCLCACVHVCVFLVVCVGAAVMLGDVFCQLELFVYSFAFIVGVVSPVFQFFVLFFLKKIAYCCWSLHLRDFSIWFDAPFCPCVESRLCVCRGRI